MDAAERYDASAIATDTIGSNGADMANKGRDRKATGEKHWRARLSKKIVREIREQRGTLSGAELARKYGVGQSTISRVLRGENWTEVE